MEKARKKCFRGLVGNATFTVLLEEMVSKYHHQNDQLIRQLNNTFHYEPFDLSLDRGFKLSMMIMPSETELGLRYPDALTDFKILIHDPKSLPNCDDEALTLERGAHYKLRVTPVSIEA